MTERVRIEHTFDCSEETFWSLFLEEKYNQDLFCGYLKFPFWKVTSAEETPTELRRVIEVEPYVGELPGAIKAVVGDKIRYREEGRLDKEKRRYFVKVVPSRLADKLLVSGEQYTESLGDKKCKRIFLAEITVKVFGVGGMIEKRIAADLERSYELGAKFTNRYVVERGL
jgi:Protein of unknown function (DUF2505)